MDMPVLAKYASQGRSSGERAALLRGEFLTLLVAAASRQSTAAAGPRLVQMRRRAARVAQTQGQRAATTMSSTLSSLTLTSERRRAAAHVPASLPRTHRRVEQAGERHVRAMCCTAL